MYLEKNHDVLAKFIFLQNDETKGITNTLYHIQKINYDCFLIIV